MLNVVIGAPCAGKSSFVVEKAGEGDLIADFSKLVSAISVLPDHSENVPERTANTAFMLRKKLIDFMIAKSGVVDSWIIHQLPTDSDMRRYEKAGAKIHVINPGRDVCLERAKRDGRPKRSFDNISRWFEKYGDDNEKQGRDMFTKSFGVKVKSAVADEAAEQGTVTMLVSAFGNVDQYGDVVVPGAFTASLEKWAESGDNIPFIWSHDWNNPMAHIGYVTEAKETGEGLVVTARVDLDTPYSRKIFKLLKGRRVTQASFGYTVDEFRYEDDVRILEAVSLIECGPCLVGANPETELLAAKASELGDYVEAGHVLTDAQVETLRAALGTLGKVVGDVETSAGVAVEDDDASHAEAASVETPASCSRTAQARARLILQTL